MVVHMCTQWELHQVVAGEAVLSPLEVVRAAVVALLAMEVDELAGARLTRRCV